MAHVRPASWQHWTETLKKGKSTFKETDKVHTSRTLYITSLPPSIPVTELEELFGQCTGFVAARRVRAMCFVDYDSKQDATNALEKFKGHKFKPGGVSAQPLFAPLSLSLARTLLHRCV